MKVRFWGVRGSCPAPLGGGVFESRLVAILAALGQSETPPDLNDSVAVLEWIRALPPSLGRLTGGNTPCVEMRTDDGELYILDLGSGARLLGNALMNEDFKAGQGRAHIFLSHLHWDHIQGWPFFSPAYVAGNEFTIHARHDGVMERLHSQQQAPFFPPDSWEEMRARIEFDHLSGSELLLQDGKMRVTWHELDHPSRAWAYRFECGGKVLVYASDGAYHNLDEASRKKFVDFYRGADLLIFDAQFTLAESFEKKTWGHSSAIVGVELACEADVKRIALFHHDPSANDGHLNDLLDSGLQLAQSLRGDGSGPEVFLAREGDQVSL
ncbi:MAG TPA: MBL fold metallo-hydrolase [Abditibacteriaceae bacterium]|jgi:phosphoribosyl 1,2-cyclic phosphodiesterase